MAESRPTQPVDLSSLCGIRLVVGEVTLTVTNDVEVQLLAALLPDDVEQDPAVAWFPGESAQQARRRIFIEAYKDELQGFSPNEWALPFTVRHAGRLVGMQWLESHEWPTARQVDTSSWLIVEMRGLGIGKAMRRAVLALAFGPLQARAAISSAWTDNSASLRVSAALGYAVTRETPHVAGERVGTLTHLRLPAQSWHAQQPRDGVEAIVPTAAAALFQP